jgi:acetoacetyl-CoA reductase/3-oxoacyl-[acyl-carrier protein] reductase
MENKTVLITGSSRGIGAGLVEGFVRKGWRVVINYHTSQDQARTLCQKMVAVGGADTVLCIGADVSQRDQVDAMFDKIEAAFGGCDVLINNAGVNVDRPFLTMSLDEWDVVLKTIMTGTFNCSQEFARRYGGEVGHIVNIGAITALSGRTQGINYCAARAAILSMTRCMALELAPKIAVNTITPGLINTQEVMCRKQLTNETNLQKAIQAIPAARLGSVEDIFNAIYSLVGTMTYVTGQNFVIDGGLLMR